jgi:hypothetical protein
MKYRNKYKENSEIIEAMTFQEVVDFGNEVSDNIVNGMPWSFEINGCPITHENDECYLLLSLEETIRFTPKDILIISFDGEIFTCDDDSFYKTYELIGQSPTSENNNTLGFKGLKIIQIPDVTEYCTPFVPTPHERELQERASEAFIDGFNFALSQIEVMILSETDDIAVLLERILEMKKQ